MSSANKVSKIRERNRETERQRQIQRQSMCVMIRGKNHPYWMDEK
jgi:hypothetical protein